MSHHLVLLPQGVVDVGYVNPDKPMQRSADRTARSPWVPGVLGSRNAGYPWISLVLHGRIGLPGLVNVYITNWKITMLLMEKSTISMAIFDGLYGISSVIFDLLWEFKCAIEGPWFP
jgi:hypothetical protein